MENETKHLIWAITLIATTILICGTLIYLNHNAWTMRFEMDDNTKEAIESIDFEALNDYDDGEILPEWEVCSSKGFLRMTCYEPCDEMRDDSAIKILGLTEENCEGLKWE